MVSKSWKFYSTIWFIFHLISSSISYAMSRGEKGWRLSYFTHLFWLPNLLFVVQAMTMSYLILLLSKRFFRNKPLLFFGVMSLPFFVISIGVDYFINCIIQNCNTSFLKFFNSRGLVNGVIISFGFMVKLFIDYLETEDMKTQLMAEKNAIELAFLKSQINPHFLFNTLNNLYGLSLSEPDKTPDAILKLSEMMRYMLYESNADKVLLKQEVTYLKNYIELQKLRYDGTTFIQFEVNGAFLGQQIAPLLLISFVENAFKHGDVFDAKHPLGMTLSFDNQNLVFEVKNKIHQKNKDEVGGIGIKNVERRLELLYPKKHLLSIQQENLIFESHLEISL